MPERYLTLGMPTSYSKALAKLRTGCHNLMVEIGRRNKPTAIPFEERFCKFCKTEVEDEVHFLTSCPLYNNLRQTILDPFIPKPTDCLSESHTRYFCQLLRSSDPSTIFSVSQFVCKAFQLRSLH